RRFGGIQILRLSRSEQSPAEPDVPSHRIKNWKHQPAAKARTWLARIIGSDDQSNRCQARLVEAERCHVGAKESDLARREADSKLVGDLSRDVALGEVVARLGAEWIVPENFLIVGRRGRIHFPQRLARIGSFAATVDLPDFDAGFLADHLYRGGPLHTEPFL